MPSRSNNPKRDARTKDADGLARRNAPFVSAMDARLSERIDEDIAKLVEEANRGEPIWWQPAAWKWGLPMWAMSGRVFRGIAALLLWRAAGQDTMLGGWLEAKSAEDPNTVVVPVRRKRGWAPLVLTRAPRMAPMPLMLSRWDYASLDLVWNELELEQCSQLLPYLSHIRELASAFLQALNRSPKSPVRLASVWTVEALRIAATLGAFIADAAYGRAIGKIFDEDAVWSRSDVAALFPWESQVPTGPRQILDRGLARKTNARILANGKRAGQLPMPSNAHLRLDRVWERGQVVTGYALVVRLLDVLGLEIVGDAVLDARRLGRELAWRMSRLEKLPEFVPADVVGAWQRMLKRIKRRSWAHRLHLLKFADISFDKRWQVDRLLPRVRAVARQIPGMTFPMFGQIPLARIGLVRLLDAMGAKWPLESIKTGDVLAAIGTLPDCTYRRYPIYKADGTRRWLDVPNDALAKAQKKVMEMLRPANPFAGVATAFEPGRAPAFHARLHEGAVAAVIIDIADFFGSIRPRHLRWAFHPRTVRPGKKKETPATNTLNKPSRGAGRLLVEGGKKQERELLLSLLFAGDEKHKWLPQGAPSSPWVANLAAHPMDRRIRKWVREYGAVKYSRYADDLVVSLHVPADAEPYSDEFVSRFLHDAETVLREAVQARGWKVQEKKTRKWRKGDAAPLTLCGIEVPIASNSLCQLPRQQHLRVRAALHRLRCGQAADHGLLAWAWGATGHPGWLAWTNCGLTSLAVELAGPILAEAFLCGWADSVDGDPDTGNEEEKVDD